MVDPKDIKLFVATPVFGGCTHNYVNGVFDLGFGCRHFGIEVQYRQTVNQAYIHLARNRLAAEFLESDYTHFMFIDQDVGFTGQDVFTLIQQDLDVVAGTYPLKQIQWENVAKAAIAGVLPEKLEAASAIHIFKPVDLTQKFSNQEVVEVEHVGTGFMLIKRQVFERLAEVLPRYFEVLSPGNRKETIDFFGHATVNDEFWGEDVSFCKRVQDAGMKVYVAPWVQCSHVGMYHFNAQGK
jgi:hypothetical protein